VPFGHRETLFRALRMTHVESTPIGLGVEDHSEPALKSLGKVQNGKVAPFADASGDDADDSGHGLSVAEEKDGSGDEMVAGLHLHDDERNGVAFQHDIGNGVGGDLRADAMVKMTAALNGGHSDDRNDDDHSDDDHSDDDHADDVQIDGDNDDTFDFVAPLHEHNEKEYVKLLIASAHAEAMVSRLDADDRALRQFKAEMISRLKGLRAEVQRVARAREEALSAKKADNDKLKDLQNRFNAVCLERKRMQKERDKALKDRDRETKSLRQKANDMKQELSRSKKLVDKAKEDGLNRMELLQSRFDDLEAKNKALQQKVERTEQEVERQKEEKNAVTSKNTEYLRNERNKMRKQLEKEVVLRQSLEDRVTALMEDNELKRSEAERLKKIHRSTEEKRKGNLKRAERAELERDDAVQNLQRKSRLFKQHQATFHDTRQEMERIVKRNISQKDTIRTLTEAVRKKSERELEYDALKKKLVVREKSVLDRERNLEQKLKKERLRRKKALSSPSNGGSSSSRGGNNKRSSREQRDSARTETKDPLYPYRNILPFHWVSLFLLVVLMMSIASKR